MQSFIEISHLLLVLLLDVRAQITPPAEEDVSKVMTFMEVYAKSICQPMEQLVDVEQEFPGEVGHIFLPPCVPLLRCSGCCGDETLECYPTLTRNITLQLVRMTHNAQMQVNLPFVEHQRCECRLKIEKVKSSSKSNNKILSKKKKKTANGCSKCPVIQEKIH